MSVETKKYILWILLSLPVFASGIYFFSFLRLSVQEKKREKRMRVKKAQAEKIRREVEIENRRDFEDYYPRKDKHLR